MWCSFNSSIGCEYFLLQHTDCKRAAKSCADCRVLYNDCRRTQTARDQTGPFETTLRALRISLPHSSTLSTGTVTSSSGGDRVREESTSWCSSDAPVDDTQIHFLNRTVMIGEGAGGGSRAFFFFFWADVTVIDESAGLEKD